MSEQEDVRTLASTHLLDEMRTLHPRLIDLSLDRIRDLLTKLGDPHQRLPPVIHVAGTNGKGSSVAILQAILSAAGLRCHRYTSPHLIRFHERIGLSNADGEVQPITEATLVDVLERTRTANGDAPMTFYEMTTAAAFLAFAETAGDAVVLEVGLGGRLDATNIVETPHLCVITPVGMDHERELGETLALIAAEKAGILKPNVPVVVGPQESDALDVIMRIAAETRAPMTVWGQDFDAYAENGRLVYQDDAGLIDLPMPALRGRHQVVNAGVAIAAARHLDQVGGTPFAGQISEDAIATGLTTTSWPARMMPLNEGRLAQGLAPDDELWLDGGHNPPAARALAQMLADLDEVSPKAIYLICGMMNDKDVFAFLEPFAGLVRGLTAVTVTGGLGASADAGAVAQIARSLGLEAQTASSVAAGISDLVAWSEPPRRIVICGSLALAGSVLAHETGTAAQSN